MTESCQAELRRIARRKAWVFWITKAVGKACFFPFFRLEVTGKEHIPLRRPFILLPKHQRWEDIPLLSLAVPRALYYIAKEELFRRPLAGWFLRSLGGIPLNRRRPLWSRRSLEAVIQCLDRGEGVVVFPEGTYYRERMGPGKLGMVRWILSRMSLPFIPVGIYYRPGRRPTRVCIRFGDPLEGDPSKDPRNFLAQAMEEIARLSGLRAGTA